MSPERNRQKNLFEPDRETRAMPPTLRREVLRLIEDLLGEAIGQEKDEARRSERETKEAKHEQNHA
jgi:hypothetical protein